MGIPALIALLLIFAGVFIAPVILLALGPSHVVAWAAAGSCWVAWTGFWTWLCGWLVDNGY